MRQGEPCDAPARPSWGLMPLLDRALTPTAPSTFARRLADWPGDVSFERIPCLTLFGRSTFCAGTAPDPGTLRGATRRARQPNALSSAIATAPDAAEQRLMACWRGAADQRGAPGAALSLRLVVLWRARSAGDLVSFGASAGLNLSR